jgi:hypothetical protein
MTQFLMRMRFSGSSHSYGERHRETQSVCVRERERETSPAKIYTKKKSHYGQALAISFHSNFKTEVFSCTTRLCKVEEQPQLTHS